VKKAKLLKVTIPELQDAVSALLRYGSEDEMEALVLTLADVVETLAARVSELEKEAA
jgi:hypothetical protein